jgi:hypothetical protein
MTTAGFATGAGLSYYKTAKGIDFMKKQAELTAKDGFIPTGGMTKDGKLWDGKISVDEYKKNLDKWHAKTAIISGIIASVGCAVLSGLTLLLRGKVKP